MDNTNKAVSKEFLKQYFTQNNIGEEAGSKVIADLESRGYTITGISEPNKTGFLGKVGQFGKDILGGTVQSFEMTGKTVQAISQATGDYLGHKAEYEKQGISFEDVKQAYLDKLNQDVGLAGRISKNTPSYAQDLGTAKGIEKTIGGIGSGLLDVATLGQGKAFTTGAKAGIKALTKEGAKLGAGYGAAEAMKQGEDIQGVAENALLGGVFGAGLGLAGGTVVKGFNKLKSSLSESVGKLESVFADVADKTKVKLNPKKLNELTNAGVDISKIDVDTFNNAMKRGYEIDKAYNLSQMTSKDKQIAQKTLDAVEKYNIDKTSTIPADIIGKNFIDKLKPATKLIKETGKEVEKVAKALKGQNNTDREILRQTFNETLQESGITGFPGNWQFSGKYEFVPELQTKLSKTLNNIYIAIQEGDDYALHNLKKGIDEVIDYSRKSNEGLSGSAENLFKNLRRQVDGVLDTTYRDYNEVNSKYSQLRTMSDELLDTLGIDLNDLNEGRATNALRGAFSNRAKRTEIRDIIANLDEILEKNGIQGENESLLRQFLFNEMLENQYGTQALTSLKGEVEKGVKGAMSVAKLLKNPLQGAGEIAGSTVERIAGQTDEDRIKFLKEFLKKDGFNQAAMPKNSNKLPKLKPNKGIVEATLPESTLMKEAKKYESAEEFRKNLIYNDDIIIHQTGKNTADKIKSEGFKSGKETGLGEKRGEVYGMTAYDWNKHGKFSKDTYARDGSGVAEVAIDIKGLKIADRTNLKFTDEEYVKGVHKQIPEGYDGVKVGYGNGVNEVLLKPEVANARRFDINDLWNKANQATPKQSLIQEARKYKSAEEFVKAQGTPVYRGGADLSKEKITDAGVSVSRGKNVADDFVKQKGGTVQENFISPNAKIVDYADVPNVKFKNLNDYSPELDTGNRQIWRDLEVEYQKAVNWAKSNGYDGVKLPLEGETRIINPDVLKTKSQLTDIWNKAQK